MMSNYPTIKRKLHFLGPEWSAAGIHWRHCTYIVKPTVASHAQELLTKQPHSMQQANEQLMQLMMSTSFCSSSFPQIMPCYKKEAH